jgi:competence protein ComEC
MCACPHRRWRSAARRQLRLGSPCGWRGEVCCGPWTGIGALLAAAAWIVLLPPKPQWRPGVFEVTAIDVGQGDSLLLITPEGKTLLLDAGGVVENSKSEFDAGEEVVSPYLWSRGIRRLDAVAISHAHTDHLGGMRSIIANFQPCELWYGG